MIKIFCLSVRIVLCLIYKCSILWKWLSGSVYPLLNCRLLLALKLWVGINNHKFETQEFCPKYADYSYKHYLHFKFIKKKSNPSKFKEGRLKIFSNNLQISARCEGWIKFGMFIILCFCLTESIRIYNWLQLVKYFHPLISVFFLLLLTQEGSKVLNSGNSIHLNSSFGCVPIEDGIYACVRLHMIETWWCQCRWWW